MGEGRDVLKALIAVCSRSCSVLCSPMRALEFDVPKVILRQAQGWAVSSRGHGEGMLLDGTPIKTPEKGR